MLFFSNTVNLWADTESISQKMPHCKRSHPTNPDYAFLTKTNPTESPPDQHFFTILPQEQ